MFEYVTRQIGGQTSRFVELIWFARGRITGVSERIAPTGSTVAAVVLGDPVRLTPDHGDTSLVADTGFLIGRTIGRSPTSLWVRPLRRYRDQPGRLSTLFRARAGRISRASGGPECLDSSRRVAG